MKEKIEEYVGKGAEIKIGSLTIDVIIQDYKESYGKPRWKVSPLSGAGSTWVEAVYIPAVSEK